MASQVGPSLSQARQTHMHRHSHTHHEEVRSPQDGDAGDTHIHLPDAKLEARQAPDSSSVVEIIQTVSVVEIIDATGATVTLSTVTSSPLTQNIQVDLPTFGTSLSQSAAAAASLGASSILPSPASTSSHSPAASTISSISKPAASTSLSPSSLSATSLASPSQDASLTVAPSTTSAFSSLSGVHNSTSHPSSLASNGTYANSFFANTTLFTGFASISKSASLTSNSSSATSSLYSSNSSYWPSSITGTVSRSVVGLPTGTAAGAGDTGSAAGSSGAAATTSATSAVGTLGTTTALSQTTQNAVIGGVVGGVAGMAIFVFVLMFVLRWKRRHGNAIRLLGDGDGPMGMALPSGPGGGGGGGGMTERRAVPFVVPSALASLNGLRRPSQPASPEEPSAERGFYRVSGKKLTSVLQSGGDGYSEPDPRSSVHSRNQGTLSGLSFYRDSQGFYGGSGSGSGPLQLGSPMRPESGIPIMRPSPARTPMQEENPFADPPSTPPATDPVGRSLASHDGSRISRGSGSRFTENL